MSPRDDTLDRIATNALGLRIQDQALAQEVYADLREQVIRSPERWRDVNVSVDLAPWTDGPANGRGSMFVASIRWEYRVRPASPTLRLACATDLDEYRQLQQDPTVAGPWYAEPLAGLGLDTTDLFDVVQFTVDGHERKVRRSLRKQGLLFTINLGEEAAAGKEIRLVYTYRVLVQRHGHVLYLDLPRPAKGLRVHLDYGDNAIRYVTALDFIATSKQVSVQRAPSEVPAKTIDIGFDGWVFPRSGVAFVWVLDDELRAADQDESWNRAPGLETPTSGRETHYAARIARITSSGRSTSGMCQLPARVDISSIFSLGKARCQSDRKHRHRPADRCLIASVKVHHPTCFRFKFSIPERWELSDEVRLAGKCWQTDPC